MYSVMQKLANHGLTITHQLPDFIEIVNAANTKLFYQDGVCVSDNSANTEESLFFRIGKWGEDLDTIIEDNGLICIQDMVALAKHLQNIEVKADDALQIISGCAFSKRSPMSNIRDDERFVFQPTLVIETEVPSINELKAIYIELLTDGGYTDKPHAPRLVSEDDMKPIPEDKVVKLTAAEEKQIAKRIENKKSFESNWNNLLARKDHRDAHSKVDSKFAEKHPLSDNFKKWVEDNWTAINSKLNTHPSLYVTHEHGSLQDMLNRDINGKNTHINDLRVFPMSHPPQPKKERSAKEFLAWIDRKIYEWNPRATLFTEPEIDEDSGEYVQEPEIIGDVNNPQNAGIDENGDDVYNDFDAAGHFLPMGNPNNETDYQKDFDPQDFGAETWNSIDEINDHHTDQYLYNEVGITETPQFTENEIDEKEKRPKFKEQFEVEWKTAPHSDEQEMIASESDVDFVRDARNWLQRENLIRTTEDPIMHLKVLGAYPVSQDFLKYLEENEINWKVANERLEQFIGLRKTAADTATKAVKNVVPEVPEDFVMPEPDYPDYDYNLPA